MNTGQLCMLDISDLNMVAIISETGSITQAAQRLHVSQPTLSKRLARLEQQLLCRLFQRNPTGLKPTHIARYLVESAAQIQSSIHAVERHVARIREHESGDLNVGVGPIIEQVLLPSVLTAFATRTGKVRLSVVTDRAEQLYDQLLAGKLDLIAGPYAPDDKKFVAAGVHSIPLISEQTINVARAEHPIFQNTSDNFYDYPYAAPPRQGSMAGSRNPDSRPGARVHTDNYNLLKTLVLSSDYICGGPRHIFRNELDAGELREIENSTTANWQSACLLKEEALDTPLVKLFLDLLVTERDRYLSANPPL